MKKLTPKQTPKPTKAATALRKAKADAKAGAFCKALASVGLPFPQREYAFSARRWRFDYAWPQRMVALEVEGGVWSGGRHTRGAGFLADIEKYNAAAANGWCLLRCTPDTLCAPKTLALLMEVML